MVIKTRVEKLDHQGRGIALHNGKVIFIPNSLPDEEVEIKIIKDKKNYAIGEVINYLNKSNKRINPKCPYYSLCGGCHLSHMNYDDQLEYKNETLVNIIKKYANLDIILEVINSEKEYGYRNKITLKIVDNKWGYYQEASHQFISIESCILAKDSINQIIKKQALFNIKNGEIIIRSNYNDEIIISIQTKNKIEIKLEELTNSNKIIGIILNDKLFYGQEYFIEKLGNVSFQVSYDNFFQINLDILSKVFSILNKKTYGSVIDLYCGVGSLGIAINKQKLYGIEITNNSIKNAKINNKLNDQYNIYINGDSSKIKEIKGDVDTIIVDPPRSGINKETLKHILAKEPNEIIYMSCNPVSLARDLNSLKINYQIKETFLLDMFPQTYHIECLMIMTKKEKL